MTNEERNTALYQKMFAEQETYRKWLLTQPPEEILNHAYEYTVREDVLLSLEYHDLTDAQADALLDSASPLGEVFKEFEKRETGYMDTVFDSVVCQADALIAAEAERKRVLLETLSDEEIKTEAARLLSELQTQKEPNSPHRTHFMAQLSPDFMERGNSRDMERLMSMLPFRSVTFSGLNDRKGHFVLIPKEEDRNQPLKKLRRSVRKDLRKTPGKSDLGATKKKKPEREVR